MWMSILGRQPELSLAELEARFGADNVRPLNQSVALIAGEAADIGRLGGSLKVAAVVAELEPTKTADLPKRLVACLPPAGSKQNIGLSLYGGDQARPVGRWALELKKQAKRAGHKLRIVPNHAPALSTAQVLHNQLARDNNAELIIVYSGQRIFIGRTVGVQDIDAYRIRDVERPARDTKVGMLPPKLAQIMLNLARVQPDQTVLDPFCGTGVVLQEALLLGAKAYGSDIAQRMVRMSETNLIELEHSRPELNLRRRLKLETADARSRRWSPPLDAVVSEIYLGPAFTTPPDDNELGRAAAEVDELLAATLTNLSAQLAPGTPLVLAVPRWQNAERRTSLPSLDRLEELGYNSTRFVHAPGDLVYARDNQIVARQLLVLSKI